MVTRGGAGEFIHGANEAEGCAWPSWLTRVLVAYDGWSGSGEGHGRNKGEWRSGIGILRGSGLRVRWGVGLGLRLQQLWGTWGMSDELGLLLWMWRGIKLRLLERRE